MRNVMIAVAGFLCLTASVGLDAAVLCSNPSGSVFVRDACKGNETPLNLVALGIVAPPPVSGFVYPTGAQYGAGFSVTKLAPGKFKLRFPSAQFTDFPAIAASAWGIPGVLPTINVAYNIREAGTGDWIAEVWIAGADGVTLVDGAFQFVAAQVSK